MRLIFIFCVSYCIGQLFSYLFHGVSWKYQWQRFAIWAGWREPDPPFDFPSLVGLYDLTHKAMKRAIADMPKDTQWLRPSITSVEKCGEVSTDPQNADTVE